MLSTTNPLHVWHINLHATTRKIRDLVLMVRQLQCADDWVLILRQYAHSLFPNWSRWTMEVDESCVSMLKGLTKCYCAGGAVLTLWWSHLQRVRICKLSLSCTGYKNMWKERMLQQARKYNLATVLYKYKFWTSCVDTYAVWKCMHQNETATWLINIL